MSALLFQLHYEGNVDRKNEDWMFGKSMSCTVCVHVCVCVCVYVCVCACVCVCVVCVSQCHLSAIWAEPVSFWNIPQDGILAVHMTLGIATITQQHLKEGRRREGETKEGSRLREEEGRRRREEEEEEQRRKGGDD